MTSCTDEIVDGIRTGVLLVDGEQRVVLVNRAFCAMFGIAGSNPIGQKLETLTNTSDGLPQLESFCGRLLSDGSNAVQSLPSLRSNTPGFEDAVVTVNARRPAPANHDDLVWIGHRGNGERSEELS